MVLSFTRPVRSRMQVSIEPLAAKTWPVVYPETIGQAMPTTVAASSEGSATLPSRVVRFIASIPCSPTPASIGVLTGPGAIAFTRTR